MKNKKTLFLITTLFLVVFFVSFDYVSAQITPIVRCTEPIGGTGGAVCDFEALGETLVRLVQFIVNIGLALSAVGFAAAGIYYLTAQGNSSKIEAAHEIFQKIIIGLIIAISAFLIVEMIAVSLGVTPQIIDLYNKFVS